MTSQMESEKAQASQWFKTLRNEIVAAFEGLEQSHTSGPLSDHAPGKFEVSKTTRKSDDGSDVWKNQDKRRYGISDEITRNARLSNFQLEVLFKEGQV